MSPRRWSGWEPAVRTWTTPTGTVTRADPAWDWIDRAIVTAWHQLGERRCPKCGRPIEGHKTDTVDDYRVAFFTCTAPSALERWQAWWRKSSPRLPAAALRQAREDEAARKRGDGDPDRARDWFTYTVTEGLPEV